MRFLVQFMQNEAQTKMGPKNLGVVFGPVLLRSPVANRPKSSRSARLVSLLVVILVLSIDVQLFARARAQSDDPLVEMNDMSAVLQVTQTMIAYATQLFPLAASTPSLAASSPTSVVAAQPRSALSMQAQQLREQQQHQQQHQQQQQQMSLANAISQPQTSSRPDWDLPVARPSQPQQQQPTTTLADPLQEVA